MVKARSDGQAGPRRQEARYCEIGGVGGPAGAGVGPDAATAGGGAGVTGSV